MIRLSNVCKTYNTRSGPRIVLNQINLSIAYGERLGILGGNGAGKSTLIRIIGGAELPSQGSVYRGMSVSWPLAFGGAFQTSLTGIDNLRFICRIYGVSAEDRIPYVEDFTELGKYLREPVKTYSAGMRAKLAFAISMAVDFDCFLIDEVTAVGDDRFREKCHIELFEKRADRAMIFVSHDPGFIRANSHRAAVLAVGKLTEFADMNEAYTYYGHTQNIRHHAD